MHKQHSNTKTIAPLPDSGVAKVALVKKIRQWGKELGFSSLGIARADTSYTSGAALQLERWLKLGRHGEMDYMAKHRELRAAPSALLAETASVISARMPYWPQATESKQVLAHSEMAYISRYALGRDYHRKFRQGLQRLAKRIEMELARQQADFPFSYRVFSDSAPVMEVAFAVQAGIAWQGKHTLALSREGSWHFLGEIYTSLDLPADAPCDGHCGTCSLCIETCPTSAIVAPYELDARLCISYLTIELHGSIPLPLRPLIVNRIYGCDDCQLCCPWNRFARIGDPDFAARNGMDDTKLVDLFAWNEQEFEQRLAGSPIRRIGHERWLRNIAVALGNASPRTDIKTALLARNDHPSALVREHVAWALSRQCSQCSQCSNSGAVPAR
jgi:epoxyqueuosine reductase